MTANASPTKHDDHGSARLAGWKRILPIVLEQRGDARGLRILWRELALFLSIGTALAYLLLVTAAWGVLKYQRDITSTRFVDLLVPSRWAIQRVRTGDHLVMRGKMQLEAGEFHDAFVSLRVGVTKSPGNLPGRLLLAQLYAAARRNDSATQTLIEGLPFVAQEADAPFLRTLFGFLLEQQDDDTVRARARELLGSGRLSPQAASLVALAGASAGYFRGNYDEAEDLLNAHHLTETHDGRLLSAQIAWERGYRDLALVELRRLTEDYPNSDQARSQLATWLRDLGQTDEFRRVTLLRQFASPDQAAPRIELLRTLRTEAPSRVPAETAALFREAGANEKILLALADFAADIGDAALAHRVYEKCRQLDRGWETAAFLNVEALIVARDYRAALELTRQLLESNREWAKRYYALFNSLQSIAYYGLGDTSSAQLYLTNFLGQADLRADNLLAVAQRFNDVGARAEARQTLAHAVTVDPLNQAALTRLIELDLSLGQFDELPALLRRLVAMRRPSPVVLRAASAKLGSDLFLFSRERDQTLALLQHALASAR